MRWRSACSAPVIRIAVAVMLFATSCATASRVTHETLNVAWSVLKEQNKAARLSCIDEATTREQALQCERDVQARYDELWEKYEQARSAYETGEDARRVYCDLQTALPEHLPAEVCQ